MAGLSFVIRVLALFSLVASSLAIEAQIQLSQRSCSRKTRTTTVPVDTCIPVAGTKYKSGSLQVPGPWPICENGEEAKVAFYWPQGKNCEEAAFNIMSTKKEIMGTCTMLMVTGSFGFVCEGINAGTPPPPPNPPPTPPPENGEDQTMEGGVIKYETKECSTTDKPPATFHAPDTCLSVNEGLGLEFPRGARCKNGTMAMVAGFKGENCDPTADPLTEPFTVWNDLYVGLCIPTDDIRSMTFWCDGLEGVDMTKPGGWKQGKKNGGGSNMALILGLGLGVGGGLVLLIGGLAYVYQTNLNFRTWVQKKLGGSDGYIAL